MKVIVAGYAKTGTKSLNVALTELGYNVFDYLENIDNFEKDWIKIMDRGEGTVEDFKRMFENVDAAMDAPIFTFWEEIHQAFPDAKIILTMRDVDQWYKAWVVQTEQYHNAWFLRLAMLLTPTGGKYFAQRRRTHILAFGDKIISPLLHYKNNEMVAKHLFQQHYNYVLQNAPKDKLLVYNVKQGWSPLCKFLEKDIPDKPFPHVNKKGAVIKEFFAAQHPFYEKLKKECYFSVGILFAIAAIEGYTIYNLIS